MSTPMDAKLSGEIQAARAKVRELGGVLSTFFVGSDGVSVRADAPEPLIALLAETDQQLARLRRNLEDLLARETR